MAVPPPLNTFLDINSGTLTLAAGDQDTDRGLRIGYSHERYPRIKITPQAAIFTGDGTSEPAVPFTSGGGGGAVNLDAISGLGISDNRGTDLDNLGTGPTAAWRWWMTQGTQAVPITVAQPTVKLSTTFGTTLATAGALANSEKAGTTFQAYAQDAAGCGIQVAGVLGSAKILTATGSDAVGVYGIGTASGVATGIGTGGYFEGRRNVSGAKALGLEVRSNNISGVAGSYSSAGLSDTQGIWITSGISGVDSGCGISFGAISGARFKVGVGFTAGSIADSTFRDDSSSTISLDVRGTHTYAIDTSNFTPAASSRAIRMGNTQRFVSVNAAGNGVVDLFACDASDRFQFFPGSPGNVVFSNGVNLVFSTGTTGSQIGTGATQKIGFYGATPIVQPTVTGSRAGNAGLASLLTTLATEGLIVDSTTAGTAPVSSYNTRTGAVTGILADVTSLFAAKGDLFAGTGAGTGAILGVGANGTVLTADSAQASGAKWAYPALTTAGGTLGADTSLTASFATFLTTASLGVGTWLVSLTGYVESGTAAAQAIDIKVVTGTATASFAGATVVTPTVAATATNYWSEFSLSVIVTVTVAGTLLFQGVATNITGNPRILANSWGTNTAGACGYTAVRVS